MSIFSPKQNEAQLEQERARGQRAKRLLDDSLIKEAFEKIENNIIEFWKNSSINDHFGQYQCRLMYRTLVAFRGCFEECVQTGEMASKTLEELQKKSRKKKKVIY